MKRRVLSGIMLTLLLISMLTLAFDIQPVKLEPTTWTVDDDGPADFYTIQGAINAASPGDTIFVYSGTYYENVVVNKTVSLIGENRSNTIIDGILYVGFKRSVKETFTEIIEKLKKAGLVKT